MPILDLDILRIHSDRRSEAGAYSDPEHILTVVYGGRCDFRIEDRRYLVEAGDVVLMQPHLPHLLIPQGGKVDHMIIHVRMGIGGEWIRDCPEVVRFHGAAWTRLCRWVDDSVVEWSKGPDHRSVDLCCGLSLAVLREIYRSRRDKVEATIDRQGGWPTVERALAVMHRRYQELIGVAEIAQEVDVSAEHLSRLFSSHAGYGPARMLLDIRIDRAQELLHRDGLTCAHVARQCGFASVHAFSRSFKRVVGTPPSLWLKGVRAGLSAG